MKPMNTPMKHHLIETLLLVNIVCLAGMLSGCMESDTAPKQTLQWFYSFEENTQSWQIDGTDLDNPPVNWTIERSDEHAADGLYAMKLYLENVNDAGKIWMKHTYSVAPNTLYTATISYQFATADFGDFNLFNIITTVRNSSVTSRDDLNYEGDTGHHTGADGFVWLNKTFEYLVETDPSGEIYVNIGVWGSWETTRSYYIDAVNITFEKLEPIDQYPDIAGNWTLQHYNFQGNLTSTDNVTLHQNDGIVVLELPLAPPAQGRIITNTLVEPEYDTEFIIKGLDFQGLGINIIYIHNETSMITELPDCESCNPSVFTR